MDAATFEREFESGNYEELPVGNRGAESDVLSHSFVVEDFGMVTDCKKVHACIPERLDYSLKRFLSIGKDAVDVKHTAHRADYLRPHTAT